jgi:hypothetical protein
VPAKDAAKLAGAAGCGHDPEGQDAVLRLLESELAHREGE